MEIDTAEAARFLAALTSDTVHTFQTFDDSRQGTRGLVRVLHGTFDRHATTLAALNLKGAGVFVMVNRGDGMGRKADNVTACRALFVDLDGAPLEPVLSSPIRPRIVVESSPGRWHCYWPVADLPPDRFSSAQKALALLFNADAKVHDKPRVMRLPGFWHNKAQPFQSRIVEAHGELLTWVEMVEGFGLADDLRLPDTIPEGERNTKLFAMAASARRQGVPEDAQRAKALAVNAARCHPPLSEAEVVELVASAYRGRSDGVLPLPLALLDAPAYLAADDHVRQLLLHAYRRANGFNGGCVTLPWSELSAWFPREKTFTDIRKRAVDSGLLTIAKAATKAMPRKRRGAKPNVYRLAIPPESAPYSQALIPPETALPEALQAVGFEALDHRSEDGGPNRRTTTQPKPNGFGAGGQ